MWLPMSMYFVFLTFKVNLFAANHDWIKFISWFISFISVSLQNVLGSVYRFSQLTISQWINNVTTIYCIGSIIIVWFPVTPLWFYAPHPHPPHRPDHIHSEPVRQRMCWWNFSFITSWSKGTPIEEFINYSWILPAYRKLSGCQQNKSSCHGKVQTSSKGSNWNPVAKALFE